MFFKNIFRPAFAAAGANNMSANTAKNDSMTYETGANGSDEFGAFTSSAPKANNTKKSTQPKKPGKKQPIKGLPLSLSSIIIAASAILAVILIVAIVIVCIVVNSNKDITLKNNAYVMYSDPDGINYVAANGVVVHTSEDELELRVADDNSFAYIIENGDEGYRVFVAKGKKIEPIIGTPVDKILATSSLKPGIVWLEIENGIYFYNEKNGEQRISRDHDGVIVEDFNSTEEHAYLFYISADASTVTYSKYAEDGNYSLYIFKNDGAVSGGKLRTPAGISDNGKYVYSSGVNKDGVTVFFVQLADEPTKRVLVAENFSRVIGTNIDGTEVLFTVTTSEGGEATYLYCFNEKNIGDDEVAPVKIGNGVYTPVAVNNNVARFKTLADKYYACADGENTSTYYLNSALEKSTLSKQSGKFDKDGNVFYYITAGGALMWIDLDDEHFVATKVSDDVADFEITAKGNAYWVSDVERELMFYNRGKDKSSRIQYDVVDISLHVYSNTLYFTTEEGIDVCTTKEGSDYAEAKFGADKLTSVPEFTNGNLKTSFAAVWDADNSDWRLFYTGNGKSFSFVATTVYVHGISAPVISNPDDEDSGNG